MVYTLELNALKIFQIHLNWKKNCLTGRQNVFGCWMKAEKVNLVAVRVKFPFGFICGLQKPIFWNSPEFYDSIIASDRQTIAIERIPLKVHNVAAMHQSGDHAIRQLTFKLKVVMKK